MIVNVFNDEQNHKEYVIFIDNNTNQQMQIPYNSTHLIIKNEITKHENNINFNIFSQKQRGCKSINNCECIIRIINCIKYYQTFNISNDRNNLM